MCFIRHWQPTSQFWKMTHRSLALVLYLIFYHVAGSDEPFRGRKTTRNVAPDGNDVLDGRYNNFFDLSKARNFYLFDENRKCFAIKIAQIFIKIAKKNDFKIGPSRCPHRRQNN